MTRPPRIARCQPQAARSRGKRRSGGFCAFCVREIGSAICKVATLAALAALAFIAIADRAPVPAPTVAEIIEAAVAERAGPGAISVGSASVTMAGEDGAPAVELRDVAFRDESGAVLIEAPRVVTSVSVADGLRGDLRPTSLLVEGAALTLVRRADGHFAAAPLMPDNMLQPAAYAPATPSGTIFDIAEKLHAVQFRDLSINYVDQRSGERWVTEGISLNLIDEGAQQRAVLDGIVRGEDGAQTAIRLRAVRHLDDGRVEARLAFDGAEPATLASQIGALGALRVLDVPVSGNLALTLSSTGVLEEMTGMLEAGSGRVVAGPDQSVTFDHAKTYFRFDAAENRFTVDGVTVETEYGNLHAHGDTWLHWGEDGRVAALTSQMQIDSLRVDAQPHFEGIFAPQRGSLTTRISLDPFVVELGEMNFVDGPSRYRIEGRMAAVPAGWHVALQGTAASLDLAQTMQLWPTALTPGVRRWIDEHIYDGFVPELWADLRWTTGDRQPGFSLGLTFDDARGRIFNTMPQLQSAAGQAVVDATGFHISLTDGRVLQPDMPAIEMAGSRLSITRLGQPVPLGHARLAGTGSIPAVMRLIGHKPFNLTEGLTEPTKLAQGLAAVEVEAHFPIREVYAENEVAAKVRAKLYNVNSTRVAPGYTVTADALDLVADNAQMQISGQARLLDVPVEFTWNRALGPETTGHSTLDGTVPLTLANMAKFGVEFPAGTVRGETTGRVHLEIPYDGLPDYTLTASAKPLRLTVPGLGWSKPSGADGQVELAGTLDTVPTVRSVNFTAPGLRANGRLTLSANGLQLADFARLRVDGWLDAPVKVRPYPGVVDIAGGTIDLSDREPGSEDGTEAWTINFRPNRLIVSEGLELHNLRGKLTTLGGLQGQFAGRVNGGTQVNALLRPGEKLLLAAKDGGAALRHAGIFEAAHGGSLRVSLAPAGPAGVYAGRFAIRDTRVRQAGVLMEILSLASIVGIVDKLAGPGIGFQAADGSFVLTPNEVILEEASAVGPSVGMTLSGTYNLSSDRVNMVGVVTPLYIVNGALERIPLVGRLFGRRRGEGLLGINYRLAGLADDPAIRVNPLSVLTPGVFRSIFRDRPAQEALSRALN